MTNAQESVLKEVHSKLAEHFDVFVLITQVEADGGKNEDLHGTHSGGYHAAIGLLEAGKHYYLMGHALPDVEDE